MINQFYTSTQLEKFIKKQFKYRYLAPEVGLSEIKYDKRAEIYSIGYVWYVLLTGKVPEGPQYTYKKKLELPADSKFHLYCNLMMRVKPEERPSLE